jgi:hypothetical protein
MANELIDAYEEIKTRLDAAAVVSGALEGVTIEEGLEDSQIGQDNCPHIIVYLTGGGTGGEEDIALNNRDVVVLNVLLRLRDRAVHKYFNATKDRGVLWMFQQVQKVVIGTNLTADNKWLLPPRITIVAHEITNETYRLDLNVQIRTTIYQRGV